jgi:hypothetical protein
MARRRNSGPDQTPKTAAQKATQNSRRGDPAPARQAKKRTRLEAKTGALEDHFAETFKEIRGSVDPGLKLGF